MRGEEEVRRKRGEEDCGKEEGRGEEERKRGGEVEMQRGVEEKW